MQIYRYAGDEKAVNIGSKLSFEPDEMFEVRLSKIPENSVPIHDASMGAVVGYRSEVVTGVFQLYDLMGDLIGMEEAGLETPLFSPLDLIFVVGGICRAIGKGVIAGVVNTSPRIAAQSALKLPVQTIAVSVQGAMRITFNRLTARKLKFTATTAARMVTK